jgi:hypothetical protein
MAISLTVTVLLVVLSVLVHSQALFLAVKAHISDARVFQMESGDRCTRSAVYASV